MIILVLQVSPVLQRVYVTKVVILKGYPSSYLRLFLNVTKNITIDSTSSINGNSGGYRGRLIETNCQDGEGPGYGHVGSLSAGGGAGYGGVGGKGCNEGPSQEYIGGAGGSTYGSQTSKTWEMGSGGGSGSARCNVEEMEQQDYI